MTIVMTMVPATGIKFNSSHSSPALKQPLSNICLSPGCISVKITNRNFRRIVTKLTFQKNIQGQETKNNIGSINHFNNNNNCNETKKKKTALFIFFNGKV